MIKRILSIALLAVSLVASADPFIPGQVLTAAGLNAAFAQKPSLTDLAGTGVNQGATLVGYKRPGGGTVARLLSDKLADTIDAKDYGVKCDGSTNDTSAINTMLTAASGKAIRFPAGICMYAGGGTVGNGTMLIGAGRNSTIIKATTASATLFTVSGYGAGIRSMAFYANVTQTGGSYVWLSGPESFIEDFFMTGDFNGILMTGNVSRIKHGRFQDGAPGAIRIRAEGGDNSQMIDDVLMGAQLPQVSSAGIRVRNNSALIISNTSVIQQGHALLIDPYTATQSAATDAGGVFSLWVHHCFFDNSGGNGIRITPTGTASVVRSRFDNIWASSSAADGVYINNGGTGTVSGIHFTSPHLMLNAGSGLTTGGTVTDVSILGGEIANNSQGLYFNSGLTGVHISGATIGSGGGVSGNTNNGIVISAGVDQVIITGNDIRGNATAISNAGGSNQYVDNNLGATSTIVGINGGTINNTSVGATTASTGRFTTAYATQNLGVGTTSATAGLYVATNATGATSAYGARNVQGIQSDVTGTYVGYSSVPNTAAASFTLGGLQHFRADNATANAGSTITTQAGFLASNLSSATNNYGFQGTLSASTANYNLYMSGTAPNYLAAYTGIGGIPTSTTMLTVGGNATGGGTSMFGSRNVQTVKSDVTASFQGFATALSTQAAAFTLAEIDHFTSAQSTIGAGSTVTTQIGFNAAASLTGATNNYGFQGNLAAATGRWNFYASGTANNAYAGNSRFGGTTAPVATVDVTGNIAATTSILSAGPTAGVGYTTGSGGTVTQATSKTTGVTLNTVTGQITMNNAALAAAATACFTLTNSAIAAVDVVNTNIASGATSGAYTLQVEAVAAGSARMCVNNRSAGSLSEAIVINYAVIKGSAR